MRKILLLFIAFLTISSNIYPGVHPYGKLIFEISYNINTILRKYGIRIQQEGEPGFDFEKGLVLYGSGSDSLIGGNQSYQIYIYESDRIPVRAKKEIIEYCINYYESHNKSFQILVLMYTEKYKTGFIRLDPFFILKLQAINNISEH